jgi:hypothetical protein
MLSLDGICFRSARTPSHRVHAPANATSGRLSSIANHFDVFFRFVSAYSQNEENGAKHLDFSERAISEFS